MNATARMQSDHRPVDLAVLVPATALRRPNRPPHECWNVLIEVSNSIRFRYQRFDTLRLDFLHHVDHVLGGMFDNWEHGAMPNRRIRSKED